MRLRVFITPEGLDLIQPVLISWGAAKGTTLFYMQMRWNHHPGSVPAELTSVSCVLPELKIQSVISTNPPSWRRRRSCRARKDLRQVSSTSINKKVAEMCELTQHTRLCLLDDLHLPCCFFLCMHRLYVVKVLKLYSSKSQDIVLIKVSVALSRSLKLSVFKCFKSNTGTKCTLSVKWTSNYYIL